jgi:drug/metabolite transporter (DMT)-like permease
MLLPFAIKTWPTAAIPITAWFAALSLAIVCTGIAFVLYFYLIAATGPTYAASVSFLSPIFGILWGRLFLDEHITFTMVTGCTIVIIGTMLASGVLKKNKLPKLSTSPL